MIIEHYLIQARKYVKIRHIGSEDIDISIFQVTYSSRIGIVNKTTPYPEIVAARK